MNIIELAREAGFNASNGFSLLIVRHSNGSWVDVSEELTHFAALVRDATLEEAALVCDNLEKQKWESVVNLMNNGGRVEFVGPMRCAKEIRALKGKQ